MNKIKLNNKGLTLVEIIISIAILAILLISFLVAFGSSYTTVFGMGYRSKAIAQAEQIISNHDYDQLVNYHDDCALMLSDPFNDAVDEIGRYCISENLFTVSKFDSTLTDRSYNLMTILVYYPNKRDYITLSTLTKESP